MQMKCNVNKCEKMHNSGSDPFPAGDWPDLLTMRSTLVHYLEDDELYVADGDYGYQWVGTPTGHNNPEERTYAWAWAHHKTVNRCSKCFGCLSMTYRHRLHCHGIMFHAIANIIKLAIATMSPSFMWSMMRMSFMLSNFWVNPE